MRHITLLQTATFAALLATCPNTHGAQAKPGTIPPPSSRDNVTFTADIQPIFKTSCVKCHGPEKQKAVLRLDSREAVLKGSENGPVFKTGKSEESPLVKAVARVGKDDHWMPPIDKGTLLTLEQVALIRAWIDQGAR